jgi:DNA polymerase III alpha subunit
MKFDHYGQLIIDSSQLCDELYCNPDLEIERFCITDPDLYNQAIDQLHLDQKKLLKYLPLNYKEEVPVELFDHLQQQTWHMPERYQNLDIANHVLELCSTQEELQRVGQELLLYQDRDLFNLLRYLKYFVDTMRTNGVVWGLGRGSSTASYVLYLLGVHKINSLHYDLPIEEFLK